MDFAFSSAQELIRTSVRKFLKNECPMDVVRELRGNEKGYDQGIWGKMVRLGFLGLAIPEEYGGTEGEFFDLVIFMEEAGRNILPAPYFSTICLCSLPMIKYGTAEQKKKYLPEIATKGQIWSLAIGEETGDFEPEGIRMHAHLENNTYTLNGTKLFVPYANSADYLLVVARTGDVTSDEEGITVFVVDTKSEGIEIEIIPTVSHDIRCQIRFNDVEVPGENILGQAGKGWEIVEDILSVGAVLKSAEVSGSARAVVEITTRYARERVQFDKPIGSFQALQHELVDLVCESDGLKNLVYKAAETINSGNPSKLLCSMAKVKANKVHHLVCHQGILIHGAIGWTEEMDIGQYHIQTKAFENDCGSSEVHLKRIETELDHNYEPIFLNMEI